MHLSHRVITLLPMPTSRAGSGDEMEAVHWLGRNLSTTAVSAYDWSIIQFWKLTKYSRWETGCCCFTVLG